MQPPMPGLDSVQSITGTTRKGPVSVRVLPQGKGSGGRGEDSRDKCKLPSAAPPSQPTALTGGSWKRNNFHAWKTSQCWFMGCTQQATGVRAINGGEAMNVPGEGVWDPSLLFIQFAVK